MQRSPPTTTDRGHPHPPRRSPRRRPGRIGAIPPGCQVVEVTANDERSQLRQRFAIDHPASVPRQDPVTLVEEPGAEPDDALEAASPRGQSRLRHPAHASGTRRGGRGGPGRAARPTLSARRRLTNGRRSCSPCGWRAGRSRRCRLVYLAHDHASPSAQEDPTGGSQRPSRNQRQACLLQRSDVSLS